MKRVAFILLAIVAGGLSGGWFAWYTLSQEQHKTAPEQREFPMTGSPAAAIPPQAWPDFTYAAENAVAAVVHVTSTFQRRQEPFSSLWEYYFGYRTPQQERRPAIGTGSGVILTTDGYIVTNNHVIENANSIRVALYDKRTLPARLVGADPVTDVAVLKVDAGELPFLPFGNSDSLRLGEWVLAIGNPYNLNSTITAGIVSAKGRQMFSPDGRYKIESFIQTDAAVNPGNSGGALVNTRGELVGINTAIASTTNAFSGYSFAVPAGIVRKVVEDIVAHGAVQRAVLGIVMTDVTGAAAEELKLNSLDGALIARVIPGSVAERAGIRQNDVITSINGVPIKNIAAVQEQMVRYRPDEQIEITTTRHGDTKHFNILLEKLPVKTDLPFSPPLQ
jgi:Do/DeqQ family serine protease